MVTMPTRHHAAVVRRLERETGTLARAAAARMDQTLPWFRAMSADDRAWVGLVAQAGITAFVTWYRDPTSNPVLTTDVFGTAPRELARAVTLAQTVDLVRATVDVVEENLGLVAVAEDQDDLREAVLRYSREIAFAAADVYARAAEERGAWDARLESATIDALLTRAPESPLEVAGGAATLGWESRGEVVVLVASAGPADAVRRAARALQLDVMTGVRGDLLIVVIGGGSDPIGTATRLLAALPPGPVVVGPAASSLDGAATSAREALDAHAVVSAWPDAPRPVASAELLPERALAGQPAARAALVRLTAGALADADPVVLETVAAYLERAGSLEATARELTVHTNTVRYRLRRAAEITGLSPTNAREAFSLRLGITLARLEGLAESL